MQRYKEENNKLIPPPLNFETNDGKLIINFNLNDELMDEYGYLERSDEWLRNWYNDHSTKSEVTLDELTEMTYQIKTSVAYSGITLVKYGINYLFDTDQDSITMCNSQIISMMSKDDNFSFEWKVYVNNNPTMLNITKQEFIKAYEYGMKMINQAFLLEGRLNNNYRSMSKEELNSLKLDEQKIKAQIEFDKIQKIYYLNE